MLINLTASFAALNASGYGAQVIEFRVKNVELSACGRLRIIQFGFVMNNVILNLLILNRSAVRTTLHS